MTVSTSVPVVGLKETLKEINEVDKVARRQITKDVQPLGRQFAEAIAQQFPSVVMHRGYQYKWRTQSRKGQGKLILPFREHENVAQAKVKINTRGARARNRTLGATYETLTVFAVIFGHRFLNVLEFAGTGKVNRTRQGWLKQSDSFIDLIRRDYGTDGGRFIWEAIDSHPEVVQALQDNISDTLNQAMQNMGWETRKYASGGFGYR